MKQQIHNRKELKERRRELRNSLTPAEAKLWMLLQHRKLAGYKFRRQHSIESYVIDFYCPAAKLIIELDGHHHEEPIQHLNDVIRDEALTALGMTIMRFPNELIFQQPEMVLDTIAAHCTASKPGQPQSPVVPPCSPSAKPAAL